MAGIFLSAALPLGAPAWALALIISASLTAIEIKAIPRSSHPLRSKTLFRLPAGLLLAALAFGGWRFQAAIPDFEPGSLAYYQPADNVIIKAIIISYPENSASATTAILQANEILVNNEPGTVNGKLELRLPAGFHLSYGDQLRLTGKLGSAIPKSGKIHDSYLGRRGVYSRMAYPQIETFAQGNGSAIMRRIYQIRAQAYHFLRENLPYQEAALLSGILLGIDWTMPRFLEDAYRATGTVHIIAISGFNITLIAWQIIHLFRRFLRPTPAALLAIAAITAYTVLVGAEPAVLRAAVMGSLAIPAYFLGRRVIGIHSLVLAATVMLLFNPFLLWDIGFQLSFLATTGLMVMADPLINLAADLVRRKFGEEKANRLQPLMLILIPTLAAQFAVSPVLFRLDAAIHPYALPANLLILPLQPLLMITSGLSVLAGLIFPALGAALIKLAWPMASFCNQMAIRIGLLPASVLPAPPSSQWVALTAVGIVLTAASVLQIRQISRPPDDEEK